MVFMFLWKDYNMWHPFATSTPLKVFPDNRQCINLPSKKLIKPAEAVNALLDGNFKASESFKSEKEQKCLKIKKDKSNFFDISSSSSTSSSSILEDKNACKKNPVLKIDIQPKSTSKTKSKNCKILNEGKKNNRKKKEVENILSKSESSKKCFSKLKKSDVSVSKLKKKSTLDIDSEDKSPINEFKVLHQNLNENLTKVKLKSPKIRGNLGLKSTKKNKENIHKIQKSNVDILKKSYSKKSNSFSAVKQIKSELKSENNNLILQKINNKSIKSPSVCEFISKEFVKEVKTDFEKSKIPQLKNSHKGFLSKPKINCTNSSDLPRKVNREKKFNKLTEKENGIEIKKIKKNASPSHICEEKKNLSHQLFSDIIEQELINSLDLTTTDLDLDEQMFESKISSQSNQIKSPKADKLKSNKNFDLIDKRHLKQKCSPETSLLDEEIKACGKISERIKVSEVTLENKNCEQLLQKDSKKKINKNQQTIEAHKVYCSSENYTIFESKTCSLYKEGVDKKFGVVTEISQNDKIFKVPPSKILKTNIKSCRKRSEPGKMLENNMVNKEITKPKDLKSVDTSGVQSTVQDSTNHNDLECFKSFILLPFMEDKPNQTRVEYLTSECWSLKNFKCGVFKVNINSQVSSCTPFFNSYFGGVLVKGKLKMKIGTKESILGEGDLAFVPPLTDWLAINVSEREAIFYYWCGRFKT